MLGTNKVGVVVVICVHQGSSTKVDENCNNLVTAGVSGTFIKPGYLFSCRVHGTANFYFSHSGSQWLSKIKGRTLLATLHIAARARAVS